MDKPNFEIFLKQINQNLNVVGTPLGDHKIRLRFYLQVFMLSWMLCHETCFFCSRISPENFLEVADLAPCLAITILALFKIFAFTVKRQKFFDLTESLKRLHQDILNNFEKLQVVHRELDLLRNFIKFYFILNALAVSTYNFQPLLILAMSYVMKKKPIFGLPYAVLLPFSTDAWIPWIPVYIYSIMCGFIGVLFYTTIDGSYYVLATCVCANLKIISDRIGRLDAHGTDLLKDIVKEHQYILRLADNLEDIFSAINLFNMLSGSLMICALGISITMGSWDQVPRCILFLSIIIVQMLTMSFFGEHIIQESTCISKAAYSCKWSDMDARSKKILLTIMIRSHKPSVLTAYKFSVINYASFTKVISTSWSYFTILRTVYSPAEL